MLYSFDDYTLDAEHYELRQAGRLVRLEPQVFNVLAYLVQHPGRTVTKEELEEHVWPDSQSVGRSSLTRAVAQVRKILADTSQGERYIQTVHRRGYRFVALVTAQPPGVADLPAALAPETPQPLVTAVPDHANALSPLSQASLSPSSRPQTPLSYTPVHLAEKILTSRSTLEGERKQVTVLYANLQEAAELLVDLDPEEAQRLLDPLLDRMMEAIHRYEGTVNHVSGDGMIALFGAPLAHEDHAARACYAALAMQKAVLQRAGELHSTNGIDIQLHVGLNSGEVVVRTIGNDLHMEYSAVGQTTYLAAQLVQLVPPGSLWLTGETLRSVEGFVRVKPLDPVRIAGLTVPVEVYELIGAEPTRTRLQTATARVLTPFVGRQHELETLYQALERARTGHGQVVAVIGEPGVGKSRLFYEFARAHHARGWLILEAGAVSSFGKATSYLPVIDLLKTYFEVDGPDDGRGTHEKVADKLLELDEALRPTLPALFTLLDIPIEDPHWQALEPPQRRQHMLDAVKRLLLRESQVQPLVVIVENLHWIDTETQAVLDSLIESLPTARLLLLVNYRPDYQHSWGNKTYYTQLRLDPLPPAHAEELLHALLGRDASLQPLTQRLVERTEGNPFFLEESVWTLAETKALLGERGAYRLARALPTIQVPSTVQAMLAARIDRLPPQDKRLLQASAVIGRDVPFPLLQAIAEGPEETVRQSLAHLQATEFLYELQLFPEYVYTFRHALTQEVAYQSLLQSTRQQYHQQIAQVLEQRFPDTRETEPELLAHHYTVAGLAAQAVPYWQRAGQRAIERSANVEAINHLAKGLEVLKTLPESPERSQQELALQLTLGVPLLMIKGSAVPEVEHVYTRAQELCQQIGDNRQRFSALVGLWRFYFNHPKLRTALELGEQCLTLAQGVQDKALIQEAHVMLGSTLLHLGELVSARTHLEAGIALYNSLRSRSLVFNRATDPGVTCLSRLAWLLWMLGYPDQALTKSQEALSLAQEVSHVYTLAFALHFATLLHQSRREVQFVQEQAEATIALSSEHGFIITLGAGVRMRGWALVEQGLAEQGIEQICQGLAIWQAQRSNLGLTQLLGLLAEAFGKGGQAAEGLDVLSKALIAVDENSEHHYEAELYRLKGELHLREAKGQKLEIIEECFLRAINIARSQQAKILELRAVISLSRLWQQWGKNKEARQMLAEIYGWFTEGFDTQDLQEAKSLLRALT